MVFFSIDRAFDLQTTESLIRVAYAIYDYIRQEYSVCKNILQNIVYITRKSYKINTNPVIHDEIFYSKIYPLHSHSLLNVLTLLLTGESSTPILSFNEPNHWTMIQFKSTQFKLNWNAKLINNMLLYKFFLLNTVIGYMGPLQ